MRSGRAGGSPGLVPRAARGERHTRNVVVSPWTHTRHRALPTEGARFHEHNARRPPPRDHAPSRRMGGLGLGQRRLQRGRHDLRVHDLPDQ